MGLSIRLARHDDTARLVELIHAFAEDVSETAAAVTDQVDRDAIGPDRLVETLLAESDGRVIGFVMFQRGFLSFAATRGVYLTDLYVEPAHRRRGVGRALMAAVARQCREHGGQWVIWDVWRKNAPALAFYEQLGARPRAGLLSMWLRGAAFERLAGPGTSAP